jgi:Leucine-rich repeat (LRR) protein
VLTGEIPPDWARMRSLQDLSLGFNLLGGRLDRVRFCGADPARGLRQLNLRANNFTGHLSVHACAQLFFLDAQDNALTGALPVGRENLALSILRLRNNALHGTIPGSFWTLPNLYSVDLQNNQFNGTISEYVNMSSFFLQILFLGNNSLTGTIPDGIGQMTQLTRLDLSYNRGLMGTLPNMT